MMKKIRYLLSMYLENSGFITHQAADGKETLDIFEREKYDPVILDFMLPKIDGFEVCKKMREHSDVPIIMLTARGDEVDKVLGLELGADDYIVKPFSPREVVARIKAVMRRVKTNTETNDK